MKDKNEKHNKGERWKQAVHKAVYFTRGNSISYFLELLHYHVLSVLEKILCNTLKTIGEFLEYKFRMIENLVEWPLVSLKNSKNVFS